MISAREITKVCDGRPVLNGVSVDVKRGECVGITGPAGCGRTTLLRILAARVRPTHGTLTIDGIDAVKDPFRVRRHVAYVDPTDSAGAGLRVGEYLSFVARVRAHDAASAGNVREAVLRAALKPDMAIDALAPNRRAALAAAAALVVRPDVLLVDDLFRAIEPAARSAVMDWLSETRQQGSALVVASGVPADVIGLCHRGLRLESGRIAAEWGAADRP
ncbi:MAG: hypothetical protein A3H97_03235 [Acidobacteria bacterium RIFCSPLOWO2_02_FULL_65_29]|nr:MAG: hypothetical protein A3H97_03235 [Acidobacteria bacterium RIFCSPLOWO2_02_FULL_65_29]